MNILRDDIEDIAARIKRRLISNGAQCVYAKRSGTIAVYSVSDARNATSSPACLVGSDTRAATTADIENDLAARRKEIAT